MRKLWIVLGVLAGLVVLVLGIGSLLPRNHVASSSVTLQQPADSVWAVIRDLGGVPRWFSDIKSSERLADSAGVERWLQTMAHNFAMPLEVAESQAPARLVTRIVSPPGAAFGGQWTYQLAAADGGTQVTITEDGWVANPVFRFMTYTLFGVHGTMDHYLAALGARFGEQVEPTHLR